MLNKSGPLLDSRFLVLVLSAVGGGGQNVVCKKNGWGEKVPQFMILGQHSNINRVNYILVSWIYSE